MNNLKHIKELFDSEDLKDRLEIPMLRGELDVDKIDLNPRKSLVTTQPHKLITKINRELFWAGNYLGTYKANTDPSSLVTKGTYHDDDNVGFEFQLSFTYYPNSSLFTIVISYNVFNKIEDEYLGDVDYKKHITEEEAFRYIETKGYEMFKQWVDKLKSSINYDILRGRSINDLGGHTAVLNSYKFPSDKNNIYNMKHVKTFETFATEDVWSIDKCVSSAISEAERKIKQGKLVPASSDFDFEDGENFEDGDPENFESIASMYAQFCDVEDYDKTRDSILNALAEKFPEFA